MWNLFHTINNFLKIVGYAVHITCTCTSHDESALGLVSGWNDLHILGWNLFLASLKWPNMTVLHCFHMKTQISSFLKMYYILGSSENTLRGFSLRLSHLPFHETATILYDTIPMYITNNVDEKKRERLTGLFSQVKWPNPGSRCFEPICLSKKQFPHITFLLSWLISITNCISYSVQFDDNLSEWRNTVFRKGGYMSPLLM